MTADFADLHRAIEIGGIYDTEKRVDMFVKHGRFFEEWKGAVDACQQRRQEFRLDFSLRNKLLQKKKEKNRTRERGEISGKMCGKE